MALHRTAVAIGALAALVTSSTCAQGAAPDPLVGVWKGTMVVLCDPESDIVPDITLAFDGKKLHVVQDGKRSSALYVFDAEKRTLRWRGGTLQVWLKEDKLTLFHDVDDPSVPSRIRNIWSLARQPTLDEIKAIPEPAVGVARPKAADEVPSEDVDDRL